MLQGLGRQLRNCGVDTLILEDGQDHSAALQVSLTMKIEKIADVQVWLLIEVSKLDIF